MLRNISKTIHPRELTWLAPFLCVGLICIGLFRPLPLIPAPDPSRTVVDADNTPVQIALPFRRAVMSSQLGPYLAYTASPETVANVAGDNSRDEFSRSIMSRIYPQLLNRRSVWDGRIHDELESILAYDPGVVIDGNPLLRRVGIPVLSIFTGSDWDQMSFSAARVETALIGNAGRGEALIAANKQAFADLEKELQPASFANRPRFLMMFSSSHDGRFGALHEGNLYDLYLERAGAEDAAKGWSAVKQDDVERILAMEPDVILLMGDARGQRDTVTDGPAAFMHDPRWRGLRAVRERRVYRMVGWLDSLQFQPLWARWLAELAHPDRMKPELRQRMRDDFMRGFGYAIRDDEIDELLHTDENGSQPGYARFTRNEEANQGQKPAQ